MIKPRKTLEDILLEEIDPYKKEWRLKLDKNENIYGCANNILSAIKNITTKDISLFPTYGNLIDKISEKYNLNKNEILFTNNLNDGLLAVIKAYLENNEEILTYEPFPLYLKQCANIENAILKFINYDKNFITRWRCTGVWRR